MKSSAQTAINWLDQYIKPFLNFSSSRMALDHAKQHILSVDQELKKVQAENEELRRKLRRLERQSRNLLKEES